jgi:hypothetical protein
MGSYNVAEPLFEAAQDPGKSSGGSGLLGSEGVRRFFLPFELTIAVFLKGQCHEIFDLWFFSSNNPFRAPDSCFQI